jgi:hypothetical protein
VKELNEANFSGDNVIISDADLLEKLMVAHLFKKFLLFVEPKGL